MKKAMYGLGLLASVMFAVAIANAQSGGGSAAGGGAAGGSAAGGSSATSSGSTGTSASGAAAPSSTGTSSRGSSGLGASSPSNLSGGAAGTGSTATGSGANVGRTGVGAGAFQGTQPGTTATQPGVTGQRSTLPPAQRSTLNQGNFTQRSAAEQQLLLDQQRAAGIRTQSGLTQGQSQFNDQQTLQQREALGEQQAAGRQDAMRDAATMGSDATQRSGQTMITGNAPGELGVFVAEGPERGVRISRVVTGSAAADAGLQPGDIIIGVGEQTVASPSDLTRLVRAIPAGEAAQLQIIRGDAEYDVDATLQPFRSQSSYGVGYRGSQTVTSGDLASRVQRLEEQLSMILDELRTVREQVVVLRGGSSESAGFDARFRSGETRTGMETEYGEGSTRDGFSSGFESRETRQGIGTEFDQRSSQSGFDSERGPVSGVDARSDTSIDARSTQPGTDQRDAAAADRSATPPSTDDDPLGLNDPQPSTPPQSERPATGDEDAQQSQTESNQELPF